VMDSKGWCWRGRLEKREMREQCEGFIESKSKLRRLIFCFVFAQCG
jgi:hypothetical protein